MILEEVLRKTTSAIRMLDESLIFLSNSFDELIRETFVLELGFWVETG